MVPNALRWHVLLTVTFSRRSEASGHAQAVRPYDSARAPASAFCSSLRFCMSSCGLICTASNISTRICGTVVSTSGMLFEICSLGVALVTSTNSSTACGVETSGGSSQLSLSLPSLWDAKVWTTSTMSSCSASRVQTSAHLHARFPSQACAYGQRGHQQLANLHNDMRGQQYCKTKNYPCS